MLRSALQQRVATASTVSRPLRANGACYSMRNIVSVPVAGLTPRRKPLRPKLPNDKFAALTSAFLDRVEGAIAPLQPPMNDSFELDRSTRDTLVIRTAADKEFEIKIVSAKQQLHFTSPISGLRKYEWNGKSHRWEDETDAHDIEGLLTRDLMRLCSGVPAF